MKLISIDDGFAQTKLFTVENGVPVRKSYRSSAKTGRYGLIDITGNGSVGAYQTENQHFTVSDAVEAETTQFDGFHTSILNRVLINHALVASDYANEEVFLMCGLPVDDFLSPDGNKNEEMINRKKKNLLVPVTSAKGSPIIKNIEIGAQAVAAYMDYLLDLNGTPQNDSDGAIAIVDIGGGTTDICVIIDGALIERKRTGTEKTGVLDVYKTLLNLIKRKFNINDNLPTKALDWTLRNKKVVIFGEEHDISDLVDEAVTEFEGRISRAVNAKLGEASTIKKVIFVGGGSALLRSIDVRGAVIADDPEFANARGLYKFAKLKGLA